MPTFVDRTGSAVAADRLLAQLRARRNAAAGVVRGLLLEIDRIPAAAVPLARKAQLQHERHCAEQALQLLLALPPETEPPKGTPEHDLHRCLQTLDAELGLREN